MFEIRIYFLIFVKLKAILFGMSLSNVLSYAQISKQKLNEIKLFNIVSHKVLNQNCHELVDRRDYSVLHAQLSPIINNKTDKDKNDIIKKVESSTSRLT